jgi:hypothetical protein
LRSLERESKTGKKRLLLLSASLAAAGATSCAHGAKGEREEGEALGR